MRRACPEIRMGVAPAAPCQCHRGRMLPPTSELFSFPHGIGTLSRPVYFEDRKGRLSPELVWESSAAHPRASAVGFTGTQVRGESKHSKASLHAQRGHLCICSVGCIVVRIPGVVPRVYTRPFWRGQSLVEAVTCVATYSRRHYNVAMFLREGLERGPQALGSKLVGSHASEYIYHFRHVQWVLVSLVSTFCVSLRITST